MSAPLACRRIARSFLRPALSRAAHMRKANDPYFVAPSVRSASTLPIKGSIARESRGLAVRSSAAAPPLHGHTKWEVHKFGGASLADTAKIRACGNLLIKEARGDGDYAPTAVVVSAMKGMTDHLVNMAKAACRADGEAEALERLEAIFERQVTTVKELVGVNNMEIAERIISNITHDKEGLAQMLKSFTYLHEVPASAMAFIAGTGEMWSAQTLCGYLESKSVPTAWLNAREVLIIESDNAGLGEKGAALDMSTQPLYEETLSRLEEWWQTKGKPMHDGDPIMVITGFVASTPEGVCTTLKRSGSDHSATIFAYILKASKVNLWKEVDGIFTTDPFKVPSAAPLSNLSYEEALEIAYFGGEVLHPAATLPCMMDDIPIYVRNFLNPDFKGTVISNEASDEGNPLGSVKGLTYIEKIAMVNVDGGGWASVPKVTQKVMAAMNDAGVKVVLVTQNSSKHSISLAIDEAEADRALAAMKRTFELELLHDTIGGVNVDRGFSILSVVSGGMKENAGLAVPFFKALGRIRCNIVAVAQGSSGHTLSVVVSRDDLPNALHAAHTSFEPSSRDISVCLLGRGKVGSELLEQIRLNMNADPTSRTAQPVNVRVIGIANSNEMILHETGMDLDDMNLSSVADFEELCAEKSKQMELNHDGLLAFLERKAPNVAIVDCTGSEDVIKMYPKFLSRGCHVVSANKKSALVDWDFYCRTFNAARKAESRYLYEASVGAGLLISTIKDLLRTGDKIYSIEGVFSGTLSYIFNNLGPEKNFTDVLAEAEAKGFTEPDPREDLSGEDMQRKVVILAREAGLELNIEDVSVESLVPEPLKSWQPKSGVWGNCATEFIEAMKPYDADMAEKVTAAGDHVLRYVGAVDVINKTAKVELRAYPKDHPFAHLQDIDNVCLFSSERFAKRPLVLTGPGTGRAVVTGGLFADLLRLGDVRSM